MARKPIKRGRAPIRSMGSKDKRPRSSQMAMNRKVTSQAYESREIEQYKPSRNEQTQANAKVMSELQSGMRPIRASQKSGNPGGDVPPPVDVTYLLSANFNAADTANLGSGDLEAQAPGSVQVGALTTKNITNGLVNIASETLRVSSTNGLTTGAYGELFVRSLGLTQMVKANTPRADRFTTYTGFRLTADISVSDRAQTFSIADTNFSVSSDEAASSGIKLADYTSDTDAEMALMLGGYDSGGVPYRQGDAKANFTQGSAAFFKYGGSGWLLGYRFAAGATTNLYPYMCGNSQDSDTFYDNLRIPDADLSDLLQPIVLDTFTDVNGTDLALHTPDVGSAGVALSGTWEIQSNQAKKTSGAGQQSFAYETGKADVVAEVQIIQSATEAGGLVLRAESDLNKWLVYYDGAALTLWEVAGGGLTSRGSSNVTLGAGTHRLVGITEGDTISCWVNDANYVTYALATLASTATQHGLHAFVDELLLDNFAIYPRGTGGEYSDLDNYPGEVNTVDPNPVYGRWNAASIAFAESVGGGLTVDEYQINTVTDGTSTVITDIGHITGVHYFEIVCKGTIANAMIGLSDGSSHSSFPGSYSGSLSYWSKNGQIRESGANLGGHPTIPPTITSVYGVIVDIDAATISWFVDGVAGPQDWSLSLIAAEAGGISNLRPAVGNGSSTDTYEYRINAGQEAFDHPENIPDGCHLGWGIDVPVKAAP